MVGDNLFHKNSNLFSIFHHWKNPYCWPITVVLVKSIIIFILWGPCNMACGILAPWTGIKPVPLALEAWSLNHWIAMEVPQISFWIVVLRVVKPLGTVCPQGTKTNKHQNDLAVALINFVSLVLNFSCSCRIIIWKLHSSQFLNL